MTPLAAKLAVFVQSPELPPQMPGEAFAKLYGLTDGELRVLLVMASGLSVTETADMLGLGQTTVRTHLARAFRKTGTSKQSGPIRLLMPLALQIRG
jgi:DNA-binding CsgD family transcriptional regulator